MGGTDSETCGRCAMTTVTDATADENNDEQATRDPFAGARIELSGAELRRVSPSAWLSGTKRRLDEIATRLTYGR